MKVVARELRRSLRALRQAWSVEPPRAAAEAGCSKPVDSNAPPLPCPSADNTDLQEEAPSSGVQVMSTAKSPRTSNQRLLGIRRSALGFLLFGTMLIGGACGVVLVIHLWNLSHGPAVSTLYGAILTGALSGAAGALLIQPRAAISPRFPAPRPGAWILAVGMLAGLVLGALATWVCVPPLQKPAQPTNTTLLRPS